MRSAAAHFSLVLIALVLYAQAPEGKRISIYTAQTAYSLPVIDHNGAEYVGLFEVLEPMGQVSARVDKHRWRVKFRERDCEFNEGKTRAKIEGKDLDLTDRFLIQNNRGLVPIRSLPALVTQLTGVATDFHAPSRRLFVGAMPVRYSAQVQKGAIPRLVLTFSNPVNPFIATEQGHVRLVFARDPLVSNGADQLIFADTVFTSADFTEANGAAELSVNVTTPVIAKFSDANRAITLTPLSPPAQATQTLPATPATAPSAQPATPAQTGPVARQPSFFILIDPAHGGSDRGALVSDNLAEKDAVLPIARRLRAELEAKGIPARLLRDSDTAIAFDARAVAINTSHAAAVVLLHASSAGNGVHIATAALPSNSAPRWETAQSMSVISSNEWANAVAGEVLKRNIAVLRLRMSVPPINEVALPALVIEIAPPPSEKPEALLSPTYIQSVASAISTATVAQRDRFAQGARR